MEPNEAENLNNNISAERTRVTVTMTRAERETLEMLCAENSAVFSDSSFYRVILSASRLMEVLSERLLELDPEIAELFIQTFGSPSHRLPENEYAGERIPLQFYQKDLQQVKNMAERLANGKISTYLRKSLFICNFLVQNYPFIIGNGLQIGVDIPYSDSNRGVSAIL